VSNLQVPKRRVSIELLACGGERRAVTVFLSEFTPDHGGAERVSDMLNRDDVFFPALDHTTARTTFVNRAAVVLARISRSLDAGDVDEVTIPTEHEVEVKLLDGEVVRGVVSYVLAPEHSRPVDFLNGRGRFFRLLVSAEHFLLVNKQHVACVTLVTR
jgi:hypothetical protein